MTKCSKEKGFVNKLKKEKCKNKTYELQNNKGIDDLLKSVAQIQYSLAINLIPIKRNIKNECLTFGNTVCQKDKEKNISEYNQGIIGLNASQNERIMLNTLATLISNSNFQLDIKDKDVDLFEVTFSFQKSIIRKLSGIHDIKTVIKNLGKVFIFKTNNRGGKYIIDRLFNCIDRGDCFLFRFSKYLAYDFKQKSDKGYAKRRGFYSKKRYTIYETLFIELLFVKTAVFKDNKAPDVFEISTKSLLENIKLYNICHENKKKAVELLNSFFKAASDFGVFIDNPPIFDKTLNRNDKTKITLKLNPKFSWTECDWNKWNV